MILLDVISLSLWAEDDAECLVMIHKHTTLPTKKSATFSTCADNQSVVRVQIFQGESGKMSDNHLLTTIRMDGIPVAPRGEVKINVTLDTDAGDTMNLGIREISTGLEKKVLIGRGRLPPSEIERMRKNANVCTDSHEELRLESKSAFESYAKTVCSAATERIVELKRSIGDMQAVKDNAVEDLRWLSDNPSAEKEALDVKRQKLAEVASPVTHINSGDTTTAA